MCDPAKEVENAGKTVSKWGEDFDHSIGVSAVSREATNAAKALGSTVEAVANDPRKLAAMGIMIAFPAAASTVGGYLLPASVAASYPTMAAIVGQTAINAATNGGNVEQAVTNALIQQGAPELVKELSKTYATEGVSQAITDWAAKATVDTSIAAAMGKDPGAALLFGGVKAATNAVLDQTDIKSAINYLPKEASSALKAAITAKVMNIDPTKAVAQDLVNQAVGVAQGMVKAQSYATHHKIPAFTEEELSRVDPDILTNANGVENFVNDTKAQREGWDNSFEKALGAREGVTDAKEFKETKDLGTGDFGAGVSGTLYSDGKFKPYGEDKRRLPTEEELGALKYYFDATDQEMPQAYKDLLPKDEPENLEEPVGGLPTNLPQSRGVQGAIDAAKSGDRLGEINQLRDVVGLPRFNTIEEYNADKAREAEEENQEPVGGLPIVGEKPDAEEPVVDLNKWEPQAPVGSLPTEPTLDNELELPEGINPTPVLDNELEPPSLLPTEPVLDNELEPPSTLPTEPVLDNELEPTCEPGYVFDHDSNSCVPDTKMPGTKPPTTKPPTTKPPTTTPPGTKPPATTTPTTPAAPTGGLPAATQSTSPTIPWLDTKPQMLEVKGGAKNNASDESLQQLYKNVDPSLMSVFADRGFTPHGYSGGSSVTSVFSDFQSSLEKGMPKFPSARDAMISTGTRKAKQSGLSSSTQLAQLKSGLGGNAKGGLPAKYAQAAPKGHNPEFITGLTGFYANGRGTGQSDDIPAMLHDGDYVMDADTVAALGDGSSKAGAMSLANFQKQVPHELSSGGSAVPAKIADGEYVFPEPLVTSLGGGDNKKGAQMLDEMREQIRAHKRSAPTSKIPPKAKSPLDYLKMVKG